uniref:Major facilitator superfamily (MFS) profile domain-containing protein n=1 Tax=Timema genevievae TaxID=629358 RepID=A0A7R9JVP5_TIMGE|nr:unnamed protein product [Timema genevievae]
MYVHLRGGRVRNHLLKATHSILDQDLKPNFPAIGSPVYGKGAAIDHKLVPFEDAIALTGHGHGKFHHLLLVGCGLCFATFLFQSLNSAYLLPAAACDFQMTVQDKGLLSSMFYVGMICSSHMWGYLADTYGRKKVLVCGMLMDSICSFFGSFSHALWLYLIVRFFNGALICPNSNVLFAYLGEFHSFFYKN